MTPYENIIISQIKASKTMSGQEKGELLKRLLAKPAVRFFNA
jgi:hypothetical protein